MIIAAAVMVGDLIVSKTRPARHHHILNELANTLPDHMVQLNEQGFINHLGEFLDRENALIDAEIYDQKFTDRRVPGLKEPFSEDLW